jgi:8-oxo-dGTP pyrophosphatase MutT (NUDIX family)
MTIAFDEALLARMRSNLAAHPVEAVALDERRHAAVAIVVVDSVAERDGDDPFDFSDDELSVIPGDRAGIDGRVAGVAGGAAFLLSRRAARMNRHAGQWALPGGRIDAGETPEEAALRELDEELGLQLPASSVLGRLDDYATRSGYVITPVVVWAGDEHGNGDVELHPNPDEVAHAYRIGLHELRRDDSPRFVTIPESDRPVVQVPLGGDLIHAPTAAVLVQFRWVALDGRAGERVGHFEQPVFAWR